MRAGVRCCAFRVVVSPRARAEPLRLRAGGDPTQAPAARSLDTLCAALRRPFDYSFEDGYPDEMPLKLLQQYMVSEMLHFTMLLYGRGQ